MADYPRTAKVTTDPEDVFRFLAEPRTLPQYVAAVSLVRSEQGLQLRVAAEVQGRHEEGDAQFTIDPARRRIAWGAEGQSRYWGRIDVSGTDGGSAVHIHLYGEHVHDEGEINTALDETVANIERLLD